MTTNATAKGRVLRAIAASVLAAVAGGGAAGCGAGGDEAGARRAPIASPIVVKVHRSPAALHPRRPTAPEPARAVELGGSVLDLVPGGGPAARILWGDRSVVEQRLDLGGATTGPRVVLRARTKQQALMRLQLAYRGARERDIRPVLRAGSGPVHRNLAGAVARLALISTCRADISVLCRFLEHDVFLHDGLLRVDIDHVMSVLGSDNPFHQRSLLRGRGITDGAAHSDPLQAGRAVLDLPLGAWHRQYTGEVDVAIDSTHYIRTDGLRVDVPPWARWPLRALVWQRHHLPGQPSSATTDAVRTRSTTPSLYSEVRSTAANVAGRIRNGMEPLTTLLVPAITYAPQDEGAAPTPGLIPQDAARAIWTVRRARPERKNPIPGFDDPGVQWLADHKLLLNTPSETPVLQPWLEAAVSKRLVVDGPRFDSDYHASWEKEAQRPNPYRPHQGPGTEAPPKTPDDNQFVRVAPAGAVTKRPRRTPTVSADVRRTLT